MSFPELSTPPSMARRQKNLGDILVSWKVVPRKSLDDAAKYAEQHDKRLGEALVELAKPAKREGLIDKFFFAVFGFFKFVDRFCVSAEYKKADADGQ